GFGVRRTDPRGMQETTWYQAWDTPVTDFPVQIDHPDGAETVIARDAFGKPTEITRWDAGQSASVSRYYDYDSAQFLCRTVEPETGATLFGHDAAGNMTWSAAGLPATTACDPDGNTATIAARKVTRSYDAKN